MNGITAAVAFVVAFIPCAGCQPPPTLDETRKLISAGKLKRACTAARQRVARIDRLTSQQRSEQLATVRLWVDCLARAGRLDEASSWLVDRPAGPLEVYTEALVLVGGSAANLPRAVKLLDTAAARWPKEAEIVYRSGLLLLTDDQPRRALVRLRRACRLRETAACRVAEAHALLDLDREQAALAAARRVVQLRPRRIDVARGRSLIRRIARRRRQLPEAVRARYRRALDELTKHDRPAAAIAITHELSLDHPDAAPLQTLLGLAQFRQGNTVEAVVALQRAADNEPGDAINHLYLAMIFESRGRPQRALTLYRRALHCDPFLAEAAARAAELLARRQQSQQAAAMLDHLVALEGGSHRSLRRAARAHLAAGSLRSAVEHFARLLSDEPKDFEAHLRLAQAFLRLYAAGDGDESQLLERARHHAAQAATTRPDNPEVQRIKKRLKRPR